ncbi:hypothetical protein PTSG_09781 [Salpingoeca rosetta]|uniref:Uncharacterized protein n=1 Tax=Salpingoeca rosetta (strain ATCC 50818 / BSB-021) TaxID=946362 RepID=F2UP16_SALR5|nr:uncharacterized protein PTSG_09781 [Salpingoeca rosetta]EGD79371.1 hypothetical protein PTSG_09781 [Salpingoeca rosetta]|eukprot:XP_004989140.1 hypothetical protein PTSG_09781 [Salpingoeca rosetta]
MYKMSTGPKTAAPHALASTPSSHIGSDTATNADRGRRSSTTTTATATQLAYGIEVSDAGSILRLLTFVLTPELCASATLDGNIHDDTGDADGFTASRCTTSRHWCTSDDDGDDDCCRRYHRHHQFDSSDPLCDDNDPLRGNDGFAFHTANGNGATANSSSVMPLAADSMVTETERLRILFELLTPDSLEGVLARFTQLLPVYPLLSRHELDNVHTSLYERIHPDTDLAPWPYSRRAVVAACSLALQRAHMPGTPSSSVWHHVAAASTQLLLGCAASSSPLPAPTEEQHDEAHMDDTDEMEVVIKAEPVCL